MKTLIRFSSLVLIFTAFGSSAPANETYKFDQSRSVIGFTVHQFLGTAHGKFTKFDGNAPLFWDCGRGLARGEKAEAAIGSFDGYAPLVTEIIKFFQTGVAPVKPEETLEIFAFMEAADESKAKNGAPVKISDVLKKTRP